MAWGERKETTTRKIILEKLRIDFGDRRIFFSFGLAEQTDTDEEGDPIYTVVATREYSYRFRECWTKGLWTKAWFNNLKATLEAAAQNLYGQEGINM